MAKIYSVTSNNNLRMVTRILIFHFFLGGRGGGGTWFTRRTE